MVSLDSLHVSGAAIARRSTRPTPWQIVVVREISPDDTGLMATAPRPSDPKAPLARLREPHHYAAKLLAGGDSPIKVSRITGYSVARINTLLADPAFSELIEHYSEIQAHDELDIDTAIKHVAVTAMGTLQERMEEEPDSFSNKELREVMTAGLDRIGKGPTSKRTLEVQDPKGVLEELRGLMASESATRIVERSATISAEYTEVFPDDEESPPPEESKVG